MSRKLKWTEEAIRELIAREGCRTPTDVSWAANGAFRAVRRSGLGWEHFGIKFAVKKHQHTDETVRAIIKRNGCVTPAHVKRASYTAYQYVLAAIKAGSTWAEWGIQSARERVDKRTAVAV